MREIRTSGSEGGGGDSLSLPLSEEEDQLCQRDVARAPGATSASLGAWTLAMCS